VTNSLRLVLCETDGRNTPVELSVAEVILVGYTGRDREAVKEHIRELERLGVAPPPKVPAIYTVPPALVTLGTRLSVGSAETSGEAEFVLLPTADGVLVAVGSDHTDRLREAVDVAESKALCGKVLSGELWRLEVLEPHWDQLELRAWTSDERGRRLYQEGRLETLLSPAQLLAEVQQAGMATGNALVFSGTLPTIGGLSFGERFEVELRDPVLNRELRCAYSITRSVD
jgi:uncharacterized protein DUF2848